MIMLQSLLSLYALPALKVGGRRNRHLTAEFLRIRRDRSQRDEPWSQCRGRFEQVEQQIAQEKMTEMVGGHADLVAFGRAHGRFQPRQVDGGIANQRIQGQATVPKRSRKAAHARMRSQVDLPGRDARGRDLQLRRGCRGLGQIPAGHDDVPASSSQRARRVQAHPGRGAGDDRQRRLQSNSASARSRFATVRSG
jgi:hypothetical protein